ncbi:MAG: ankyrin repeat domain-containing protein [Sphingobacteriia bacterium]|nr:ankyrin repeat domain-containing protein [Sphingobacteriia bacterium]
MKEIIQMFAPMQNEEKKVLESLPNPNLSPQEIVKFLQDLEESILAKNFEKNLSQDFCKQLAIIKKLQGDYFRTLKNFDEARIAYVEAKRFLMYSENILLYDNIANSPHETDISNLTMENQINLIDFLERKITDLKLTHTLKNSNGLKPKVKAFEEKLFNISKEFISENFIKTFKNIGKAEDKIAMLNFLKRKKEALENLEGSVNELYNIKMALTYAYNKIGEFEKAKDEFKEALSLKEKVDEAQVNKQLENKVTYRVNKQNALITKKDTLFSRLQEESAESLEKYRALTSEQKEVVDSILKVSFVEGNFAATGLLGDIIERLTSNQYLFNTLKTLYTYSLNNKMNIVISDKRNVKDFNPEMDGSLGYYNLKNSIVVAGRYLDWVNQRVEGTLMHEATHYEMQMLFSNEAYPYSVNNEKEKNAFENVELIVLRNVAIEAAKLVNEFSRDKDKLSKDEIIKFIIGLSKEELIKFINDNYLKIDPKGENQSTELGTIKSIIRTIGNVYDNEVYSTKDQHKELIVRFNEQLARGNKEIVYKIFAPLKGYIDNYIKPLQEKYFKENREISEVQKNTLKLIELVKKGKEQEAFELIDNGIDLNVTDIKGHNVLQLAIAKEMESLILPLAKVADNLSDKDLVLEWALNNNQMEIISVLIEKKYNFNVTLPNGKTPLIQMATIGNVSIVRELIKAGANVNTHNASGQTALISATKYGHLETVKELVKSGAKIEMKDRFGKTAIDYAKGEMKELFKQLSIPKVQSIRKSREGGAGFISSFKSIFGIKEKAVFEKVSKDMKNELAKDDLDDKAPSFTRDHKNKLANNKNDKPNLN